MRILSNLLRAQAGFSGLVPKVVEEVDSTARLALTSAQVNVGDIVREIGQDTIITIECVGDVSGSLQWQAIQINGNEYYFADGGDIHVEEDSSAVDVATALTAFLAGLGLSADRDGDFITIVGDASLSIGDPYESLGFDITEVQAGIAPGGTFVAVDVASLSTEEGWQKYGGKTPLVIRVGYGSSQGVGQSLSAGAWTKLIFSEAVSGGDYIDLEEGTITPPAGFGIVSLYAAIAPHATAYIRTLSGIWANGSEVNAQSARLFDGAVIPKNVLNYPEFAAEASLLVFSEDGTTSFEGRVWAQSATTTMIYQNSGTRMVILWFPS